MPLSKEPAPIPKMMPPPPPPPGRGLVDEGSLGGLAKSTAVSNQTEVAEIVGGEDALLKENMAKDADYGTFSGNHFRATLRWNASVDLDLRMVVKGQSLFRTDKVMRINWGEEKDSVFNLEADERGGNDGLKSEVISFRDDWQMTARKFLGGTWDHPPDGQYWISAQYFSSQIGSQQPVEPPADKLQDEILYDADLFLGEELDSGKPRQAGAVRGKLKWDSNMDKRTVLLFGFEKSGNSISGFSPTEVPEDHWRQPRNGWW